MAKWQGLFPAHGQLGVTLMLIQVGDRVSTPCDGTWEIDAILDVADLKLTVLMVLVEADSRSKLHPTVGELRDMTVRQLLYCLTNDYFKHEPRANSLQSVVNCSSEDLVIELGQPPVRIH